MPLYWGMALTLREVGSRATKLAGMMIPIGLGLGASKLAAFSIEWEPPLTRPVAGSFIGEWYALGGY